MDELQRSNDDRGSTSLNYRDGKLDVPDRRRFAADLIGGLFAGVIAVIISGAAWSMPNTYIHRPLPGSPPRHLEWQGPSACTGITLAALVLLAVIARRDRRRGLAMGMLIGGGVMLLVEGACFYQSWR